MPASPRKNVIFLSSFTAFHLFSIPYVVVSLAPLQQQNINFRGLSVRSKVGISTGRGLLCQARGQHSSICNPRSSPPPQFRSFSFFFTPSIRQYNRDYNLSQYTGTYRYNSNQLNNQTYCLHFDDKKRKIHNYNISDTFFFTPFPRIA